MRVLAAFLLATLVLPAHASPYADAENLEQAFGIVFTARLSNNYLRMRCAQWYPEMKSAIDRHYYTWENTNANEMAALDRLIESYSASYLAGFRTTSGIMIATAFEEMASQSPDRREFCDFAVDQMTGEFGIIRVTTPMASTLLLEYLADNPLSELESHDRDSEIGCVKHGLNSGGDLDELIAYCGCARDTMVNEMSEAERAEYYQTIMSDGASAARALPQIQALGPKLERCSPEEPPDD